MRNAIVDSGVTIPEGTVIGYGSEIDRENFVVTDGGRLVVTSESILMMQSPKTNLAARAHTANAVG
jgi:ADP-glucose pyrophosphorylase